MTKWNENWDQEQNQITAPEPETQRTAGAKHGQGLGDTLWKYEQLRAGKVYNQFMFTTRQQAEDFAARMKQVAPDLFGHIEQVQASTIWN